MTTGRRILLLLLVAVLAVTTTDVWGRAKTDIVLLANGDKITGEIKKMEFGKLSLKTDGMSTVEIEWADITDLTTQYYFRVQDVDGYKYFGTPRLEEGVFRIFLPASIVTLEKDQIVEILPLEDRFWERLKGSLSLGASYNKGSGVGKLDFSGDVRYRTEHRFLQIKASSNFTTQLDVPSTTRAEASLTYQRLFQRRFFSDLSTTAFRNDELGVALRTTVSAGLGVEMVHSNSHLLVGTLGLSVNREWASSDSVSATNNVEGVLSTDYSIFKYDTPKTDLSTYVGLFPRLPDFDRVRLDLEVRLRQELIKDFFVELTFYDNFDSKPPSEGAQQNDWGIVTSFGYTW
jgi:hypothetical protein